jgi:two-component system chemotaxis response regulator CheB
MSCSNIIIGGSAGGIEALDVIIAALPPEFPVPVLVVQHLHPNDGGMFVDYLARRSRLPVIDPCDKEPVLPGRVYAAPANYHMLVERDGAISLSADERVNWSRPSIDVLFESGAAAWGTGLVAVLLSGANMDGAAGIVKVREAGGLTIAQDPAEAPHPIMPQSAIDTGAVQEVLMVKDIARRLVSIEKKSPAHGGLHL